MKSVISFFIILIGLLPNLNLANGQYDQYGGWKSVKAPAKGFFYLGKVKDRSMLITPDGHGYFALGINHLSGCQNEQYNHIPDFQNAESITKRIKDDLDYWGMNHAGSDCPEMIKDEVPFFVTLSLTKNAHWLPPDQFEFVDVFETDFKARTASYINKECEKHKNNPFLIGYYWTDTPRWDVVISRKRHGIDWVSFLRNLDGGAAGKKRYVSFLERKYKTIAAFNKQYGLFFHSFQSLVNARFDHIDFNQPYVIADDTEFLGIIAEHLYKMVHEIIKKYDPNRLLFGEKYIAGDHPDVVLTEAAKYVDVISIQPGPEKGPGPGPGQEECTFNAKQFNHIHQVTQKPVMICDHAVSFYTHDHPVTLWHQFENEALAGEATAQYIMACAFQPFVIGYGRCQYLDFYDAKRGLLKQGLLDQDGKRHTTISQYIRSANNKVTGLVEKILMR